MLNQAVLKASNENNEEMYTRATDSLIKFHSIDISKDLQQLDTFSSQEVSKMLASNIGKFLPSN